VVWIVTLLNLAAFTVESAVAQAIGSVSLFADSIDFLEDASLNLLIALATSWSSRARARLGIVLGGLLLVPGLATLWTVWKKFNRSVTPDAALLSFTATAALVVNLTCALMLARYRQHGGSLTQAAYLSARNDVWGNAAAIAAGLVTALLWSSSWPDLVVGLGIVAVNAGAAAEVWQTARHERGADA
jgi:Co/Zn/Cd efflux system component